MKNLTLRVICLALVAMLSLAFVACDNGSKDPKDSSSESNKDSNKVSDTVSDTGSDTASDTVSDTEAETEPNTGTTGLRAIKGTVSAYIDGGTKQHRNLKTDNDAWSMLANCGGAFKAINLYTATYDHDNGDTIFLKVYAWDTDYATTVAGEALVDITATGYPNGGWYLFEFEQALEAGEYLVVITGTSDGDSEFDFGTAIWTMDSTPFVTTFLNGEDTDNTGIWAQWIVE